MVNGCSLLSSLSRARGWCGRIKGIAENDYPLKMGKKGKCTPMRAPLPVNELITYLVLSLASSPSVSLPALSASNLIVSKTFDALPTILITTISPHFLAFG